MKANKKIKAQTTKILSKSTTDIFDASIFEVLLFLVPAVDIGIFPGSGVAWVFKNYVKL